MSNIFNDLKPFFEDNYNRIHVREYAKIQKISPPTSSKLLEKYHLKNFLKKELDKQYIYYYANKSSEIFKDLQRIYWKIKLKPIIKYIENETINPIIILFGSIAKGELKKGSDIDLAIFTHTNKKLNLTNFEDREIQVFKFKTLNDVPKELKNNILNGYKLSGTW